MKRIYLDYAASTPVAPEVEAVMRPYFLNKFGNAGSLHSFGQEAIAALDESRESIANAIGADFREIIFTGSATESNNLALRGVVRRFMIDDLRFKNGGFINHKSKFLNPRIIVSTIEHESVLETARELEKEGVEVIYIPVSKRGIVDLKKLKESLNERTILVSVMYANNEIGTIQPISEISEIIRNFMETRNKRQETSTGFKKTMSHVSCLYPLFHTDAVQAFQFLDCNIKNLGVDLMTLSAHKIYGPKGVGALYIKRQETRDKKQAKNSSLLHVSCHLSPIVTGGGQEFGLRSGTENIPLIVGFAEAVRLVAKTREKESERIAKLRDYLWKEIKKIYPKARTNAGLSTNSELKTNIRIQPDIRKFGTHSLFADVLPNFLSVYFPDYKAEDLLVRLDLAGIAVSTGSACSARSAEPSYVIKALGLPDSLRPPETTSCRAGDSKRAGLKGERFSRSLRITLGRQTSKRDIDTALGVIRKLISQ